MRVPSWLIVTLAVIVAIPFGWGLGVLAAQLAVGRDVGVLPVVTIPVAVIGAIVFAVSSVTTPLIRLGIMAAGLALFFIVL